MDVHIIQQAPPYLQIIGSGQLCTPWEGMNLPFKLWCHSFKKNHVSLKTGGIQTPQIWPQDELSNSSNKASVHRWFEAATYYLEAKAMSCCLEETLIFDLMWNMSKLHLPRSGRLGSKVRLGGQNFQNMKTEPRFLRFFHRSTGTFNVSLHSQERADPDL